MKTVLKYLSFALILLIGCSENQQINSPIDNNSNLKSTNPNVPGYMETQSAVLLDVEPDWINMPSANSSTQSSTFYKSQMVYNDSANNIIIDTFYLGGMHDTVEFKFKLKFMPGDLPQDSMFVTVELDIENGTLKFGPAAVFNSPARLDYKIKGLDFSVMDPYKLRFIYACDNGIIEPVVCEKYEIKESDGSIQMWKGEIPHFSRYGFVRRNVGY
ncbi:MAG: hypothetical protein HND52_00790 [Ignavibacteriae bacterium]|nr:hypothetical protein [Ignavibacteriota bacterium]NOG96484.1 hypothetical protein [Ignavibacteriota bacterium]